MRQFGSEAKVQQIVPFHSLKDYDVRDELVLVMPSAEQWGAFSVHIHQSLSFEGNVMPAVFLGKRMVLKCSVSHFEGKFH